VVAVAAALVVVTLVAVAAVSLFPRERAKQRTTVASGGGAGSLMALPVWLPEGAQPVELSASVDVGPAVSGEVWRRAGPNPAHLVRLSYTGDHPSLDHLGQGQVDVDVGPVSLAYSERDRYAMGVSTLEWAEGPTKLMVVGRDASFEELVAFAFGAVPEGFELAHSGDLTTAVRLMSSSGDVEVRYALDAAGSVAVSIDVVADPGFDLSAYEWVHAEPVALEPGGLFAVVNPPIGTVVVRTDEGLAVRVTAMGLTTGELEQVARSVTRVSAQEWNGLADAIPAGSSTADSVIATFPPDAEDGGG
jgi:hypothetical protein